MYTLIEKIASFLSGNPDDLKIFEDVNMSYVTGDGFHHLLHKTSYTALRWKLPLAVYRAKKVEAALQQKAINTTRTKTKSKGASKQKGFVLKKEIAPPDISDGLGRNKNNRDINRLKDYLLQKRKWALSNKKLYVYQSPVWKCLDSEHEAQRVFDELFAAYPNMSESLTSAEYSKLYNGLLADYRIEEVDFDDYRSEAKYLLNCKDGVIDLSDDSFRCLPHDPRHHFTYVFDVYCREIKDPTYGENFENYAVQDDSGVRIQLLESLALALTGAQAKLFYVLLGDTDTGKSQWIRFVTELLGHDNVESVRDIKDFAKPWTTGSLAGKLLAICSDLPNGELPRDAIGIIKQFCGGVDGIKGEQKYKNSFTYYTTPLLMMAGNHPVRIPRAEKETAFWNRMVVIPLTKRVSKEERVPDFFKLLLDEVPYIIHEAALALQALIERNLEPTRVELPPEYRSNESNCEYETVYQFVKEEFIEAEGHALSSKEIFERFSATSTQINENAFYKYFALAIKDLIPNAIKVKRISGSDDRGYLNLDFSSETSVYYQ